jgi:hypothetical protein
MEVNECNTLEEFLKFLEQPRALPASFLPDKTFAKTIAKAILFGLNEDGELANACQVSTPALRRWARLRTRPHIAIRRASLEAIRELVASKCSKT